MLEVRARSDEALLAAIAARDRGAFAEFYDRHAGRVLTLARRILRNVAWADDALQETFWQVWQRAGRFDPQRASAVGWLASTDDGKGLDRSRILQKAQGAMAPR